MKFLGYLAALPAIVSMVDASPTPAFGSVIAATGQKSGDARMYFSAPDGSVHEYGEKIGVPFEWKLLPAGTAVPNTPLATISNGTSTGGYATIWLYFIDADGTTLRERVWMNDGQQWRVGNLSASNFKVAPGSRTLYALPADATSAAARVGFTCAGGLSLCEAYQPSQSNWQLRQL